MAGCAVMMWEGSTHSSTQEPVGLAFGVSGFIKGNYRWGVGHVGLL